MTNEAPLNSPIDQPISDAGNRSATGAEHAPPGQRTHDRLLQSRSAVLGFVFLIAGVVGLPLLWVNPNFSRGERIFWTVIVLLYTSTLLILFGGMLWWIYQLIVGG